MSLLVERGMHGATGNIYVGLHEFEEMAFALHMLRPGDLMVDIGANIGTYTLLAAGVCGASVLACEPIPGTFAKLEANIEANHLRDRVQLRRIALGARRETLRMTDADGAANRVLPGASSDQQGCVVDATTLDDEVQGRSVALIKIDVEGHEREVLRGAMRTLPQVSAVLIESADAHAWQVLIEAGLHPYAYDPWTRRLTAMPRPQANLRGNTLFVRDQQSAQERCRTAPPVRVKGLMI